MPIFKYSSNSFLETVLYFRVLTSGVNALNVLTARNKNFCVQSQASLSVVFTGHLRCKR